MRSSRSAWEHRRRSRGRQPADRAALIATDYATPPGVLGPVFVGPDRPPCCPTEALQNFQTWNQAISAGESHAVGGWPVPRLRAAAHREPEPYTVVFDSGNSPFRRSPTGRPKSRPSPSARRRRSRPATCSASTARACPVDTGVTVNPDTLSYPAPRRLDAGHVRGARGRQPRSPSGDRRLSRSSRTTAPTPSPPRHARLWPTPAPAQRPRPPSTRRRAASRHRRDEPGRRLRRAADGRSRRPVSPRPRWPARPPRSPPASSPASPSTRPGSASRPRRSPSPVATPPRASGDSRGQRRRRRRHHHQRRLRLPDPTDRKISSAGPARRHSGHRHARRWTPAASSTGDHRRQPGLGLHVRPHRDDLRRDASETVPARRGQSRATIGIAQIDITAGGQGYDSAPTVTITDTVGAADKGASATATRGGEGLRHGDHRHRPGCGLPHARPEEVRRHAAWPRARTAANNLGQYIPVAVPDTTTYPGTDYYEIAVVQYRHEVPPRPARHAAARLRAALDERRARASTCR